MRLADVTPDLPSVLRELGDAPCWQAKRGYGTFITFEFGARVPRPTRRGMIEGGELHLWIYFAEWNLKVDGRRVSWRSAPEKIDRTLARFIGRTITGFSEHPACIRFSGDAHITLHPMPSINNAAELFLLYLPGERVMLGLRD
jgi:hypothetical protein